MQNTSSSGPWRALALIAALLLGSILIFSAFTKFLSPKAFVATIESYQLLPAAWALPAATGVIGIEVALGVLLVLGFRRRAAAWMALPLVVFFTVMVVRAMNLGLTECGCFGEVIKMSPPQELGVDIAMLLLTLLVIFRGEDVEAGRRMAPTLGWVTLCVGAAAFLAAGPVASSEATLEIERAQLETLVSAQPALVVEDEAFLYFFSADCDHCWAYVGAVEMMHQRVDGLSVHGVTFSDPGALEEFDAAFSPSFPIHVVRESVFHAITKDYPAAVWISGGEVVKSWAGFAPSHREVADAGGYLYRPIEEAVAEEATEEAPAAADAPPNPFGGPVRGRH